MIDAASASRSKPLREPKIDDRDLAIAALAAAEAALIEQLAVAAADLASVEADRDVYRALALTAIHLLHDTGLERGRERDARHRLIDEYRALRARVMTAAVAA
jgi:hypothetical protein